MRLKILKFLILGKKPFGGQEEENKEGGGWKNKFPPNYICCKKNNHTEFFCQFGLSIKCKACHLFGHMEKICKNKANQKVQQAQVVDHEEQNKEY